MRLAGITIVRNECDIVEAFVRHNGAVLDQLYVIDNNSSDGTLEILERLAASHHPIKLGRDDNLPYYQAARPRTGSRLRSKMRRGIACFRLMATNF